MQAPPVQRPPNSFAGPSFVSLQKMKKMPVSSSHEVKYTLSPQLSICLLQMSSSEPMFQFKDVFSILHACLIKEAVAIMSENKLTIQIVPIHPCCACSCALAFLDPSGLLHFISLTMTIRHACTNTRPQQIRPHRSCRVSLRMP